MSTLSEAIGGGMPLRQSEIGAEEARVGPGPRASVAVTDGDRNRVVAWVSSTAAVYAADLRQAWCWPSSVPTLARAWAGRYPDRDSVPGGNAGLYYFWIGYNHMLGLPLIAAVYALIGVLTPLVWVFLHPARAVLFLTVAAAAAALIL